METRIRPPAPTLELSLTQTQVLNIYVFIKEFQEQAADKDTQDDLKLITDEFKQFLLRSK